MELGFFGLMPNSLLQSVGRGYSDLCGAMAAAGLRAVEYQIWKEVDGIFTADPSKVPSARLLATVTAEEAVELTFFGSEVWPPEPIIIVTRIFFKHTLGRPSLNHGSTVRLRYRLATEKREPSQRLWHCDVSI